MTIRNIIAACVILAPILWFGATFYYLTAAEDKARRLAMSHDTLSAHDWQRVYDDSLALWKQQQPSQETITLSASSMSPSLSRLGFDECYVRKESVTFRYGGGFMMNSAHVAIHFSSTEHRTIGAWYLGWSRGWQCGYSPPVSDIK